MLQSLHVHNFALLEDARVEFLPGFNVFTGETGAGKSILVDAFGILLGNRASIDYIRRGADSFWVQAVFDIANLPDVQKLLEQQGIEGDDELFLKRQVTSAGKSKIFINEVQVPLAFLKKISSLLVDIHGQHENQVLLHADAPRILTDTYGGKDISLIYGEYVKEYRQYIALRDELHDLENNNRDRELLLDRYNWEIKEISEAGLRSGEEETLREEARLLQNSEKVINSVSTAHACLDDEQGVLNLLADAKTALSVAARYDVRLKNIAENVESSWITLEDCRQEISEYLAGSDFDSGRAVQVQERLDTIYRLHKKYGGSTESVLEYLAAAREKCHKLENIAQEIERVEKRLQKAAAELKAIAARLTECRRKKADKLSAEITAHIRDLAMPDGVFRIQVQSEAKFTEYGADKIIFLFSANVGELEHELAKVASGGELSRIALAVKTVMMNNGTVPTMVFDEIDTGVGGVTAKKMAEKIAAISRCGQVLCITHLPQIAAFADRHIHIAKYASGGRTVTQLQVLDKEGRIKELMRMMTGANEGRAAYDNAGELLRSADLYKAQGSKE